MEANIITIFLGALGGVFSAIVTVLFAERRLNREYQLEFATEQVIRNLLETARWKLRSFEQIKKRLGGFADDELRQTLVRAGAVRFENRNGVELWGLIKHNRNRLSDDTVKD